jgi:retron-type reverse transcriptase
MGKKELIRSEMIRLGFWKAEFLSPEEERQQALEDEEYARLLDELRRLQKEAGKLENMDHLVREARQKRIVESKKRRAERKERREKERAEAMERWLRHKETHVIHAGEGVSFGLNSWEQDEEKLKEMDLPLLGSASELAEAMGISLSKLKWLTYHRDTATLCHYTRFTIPKKNGGVREISAPKPELRKAQEWVKVNILDRIPPHSAAYGFVPGRSIVDNAACHLGRAVVIKMDVKDFFPSITFRRVKGLFRSFGYSEGIATLLALLCTEPPRQEVEFDGMFYYVAMGERQLPQGACTSPAITNLMCRRLDARLQGLAEANGFTYTRYADDLTFSGESKAAERVGRVIHSARAILRFEGFAVNDEKTRILRSSGRQRVTGIVVNEKPNLSRRELRRFRALLHNVEKYGPERENQTNNPRFWESVIGYASYVRMVRPDLEVRLAEKLARISREHGLPIPRWARDRAVARN